MKSPYTIAITHQKTTPTGKDAVPDPALLTFAETPAEAADAALQHCRDHGLHTSHLQGACATKTKPYQAPSKIRILMAAAMTEHDDFRMVDIPNSTPLRFLVASPHSPIFWCHLRKRNRGSRARLASNVATIVAENYAKPVDTKTTIAYLDRLAAWAVNQPAWCRRAQLEFQEVFESRNSTQAAREFGRFLALLPPFLEEVALAEAISGTTSALSARADHRI